MNNIRLLHIVFFRLLSPSLLSGAEHESVVDAIGSGTTRQDALHDAMRKAIANAVGMYVSTKSVLKDDDYKQQVVIASDAVVTNYDELDATEHNGMWMMKIRARILPNELLKYCPQLVTYKVSDVEVGNLLNKRDALKNADAILSDIFQDYCLNMFKFTKRTIRLASDDNSTGEKITFYVDFICSTDQIYYDKIKGQLCTLLDKFAKYKINATVLDKSIKHKRIRHGKIGQGRIRQHNSSGIYNSFDDFRKKILMNLSSELGSSETTKDLGFIVFEKHDNDYIYYTVFVVPKRIENEIRKKTNYNDRIIGVIPEDALICAVSCADKIYRDVYYVTVTNIIEASQKFYTDLNDDVNPLIFSDHVYIDREDSSKINFYQRTSTQVDGALKITIPEKDARLLREVYIYIIGHNFLHLNWQYDRESRISECMKIAKEIESKFCNER